MTSDLRELLANIEPVLNPGNYAFIVTIPRGMIDLENVVAAVHEPEGLTLVVPEEIALGIGVPIAFTAAWITLNVQSDLTAVGLTSAFSTALANVGISCNVIAGVHHDHLFVPVDQAQRAMNVLLALQQSAA